jgi:hypothetical protein
MAWHVSSLLYKSTDSNKLNSPQNTIQFSVPPIQVNPPTYDPLKSTYSQFIDKLIDSTTSKFGYHLPSRAVDRKSLSQGVKLVEIAVDEFESGNEAIGLDVYLSGLDKIIMALPSKKYTLKVCLIANVSFSLCRFKRNQDKGST